MINIRLDSNLNVGTMNIMWPAYWYISYFNMKFQIKALGLDQTTHIVGCQPTGTGAWTVSPQHIKIE